jgi:proline iminopeptidase
LRDHPRSSNQIGVRFSGFGSIGVAFRAFPPCSFVSSLVKGLLPPSLAISPRRTPTRLLGDSYGGLVAMAYPAAHPEHVAKLILSDSPGPSWQSIVDLLLPDVFPDIEEENKQEAQKLGPETEAAARAGLRNHFRMIFYSTQKRDAYMSHMGDLGYEPAVAEAVAKATADLDLTSNLAGFKFPTLVIDGRYDMNVAPLTAWRLAHAIPGAKIVFFEQSGHLPAYEEPGKYIEVLEGFLNGK